MVYGEIESQNIDMQKDLNSMNDNNRKKKLSSLPE